ncbi:U6 snRNA-associated Sm-like protein LSm6 [Auxenochlorella protothecoides]|uniref:U6 snRNA-associated Sm-like protein LSm6 n=1 Tax=Auxenochlorella protothecoides TaxID=3075 RepID=A0A087SBF4_AUXPR|nr:U6 snRNA-associated Sm-like protein LSm6 [Auxenochlorella protothecoides]KFM23058.1 U6 snRNA-associated Sm-like protein LSm6 [Auxenochlorella protothecoides]
MADSPTGDGVVSKAPADFLKSIRGQRVIVKLNSGVDYKGILACLDGFMNIAMEQTEEYVNGQLKNRYGDCFIRGNNGGRGWAVWHRLPESCVSGSSEPSHHSPSSAQFCTSAHWRSPGEACV